MLRYIKPLMYVWRLEKNHRHRHKEWFLLVACTEDVQYCSQCNLKSLDLNEDEVPLLITLKITLKIMQGLAKITSLYISILEKDQSHQRNMFSRLIFIEFFSSSCAILVEITWTKRQDKKRWGWQEMKARTTSIIGKLAYEEINYLHLHNNLKKVGDYL